MRVFTYYCSYGEPLNTNHMKSTKFIKFLKDARLLQSGPDNYKFGSQKGHQAASLRNINYNQYSDMGS